MVARRKNRRHKPICCFVFPSSPLLRIDTADWMRMSPLCRMIYTMFKHHHPRAYSPEAVYEILQKRLNDENFSLETVWKCLDSSVMRKYIYRRNRLFWNLITERQVEAYKSQFAQAN